MGKGKKHKVETVKVEKIVEPYVVLQDCLVIVKKEKIRCENVFSAIKKEYKHIDLIKEEPTLKRIVNHKLTTLDMLIVKMEKYIKCFNEKEDYNTTIFVLEIVNILAYDNQMSLSYAREIENNKSIINNIKEINKNKNKIATNKRYDQASQAESCEESENLIYTKKCFNKLITGLYNDIIKDYKNITITLYKYVLDKIGIEFYDNYSFEFIDSKLHGKLSDKYNYDKEKLISLFNFEKDSDNILKSSLAEFNMEDMPCNELKSDIKLSNDLCSEKLSLMFDKYEKYVAGDSIKVMQSFLHVYHAIESREIYLNMLSIYIFKSLLDKVPKQVVNEINQDLSLLDKSSIAEEILIEKPIENEDSNIVIIEDLSASSSHQESYKDNEIFDDKQQLNTILDVTDSNIPVSASGLNNEINDEINEDRSLIFSSYSNDKFKNNIKHKTDKIKKTEVIKEQNYNDKNLFKVNLERADNEFVSIFGMGKKTCSYKNAEALIERLGGWMHKKSGSHYAIVFERISDQKGAVIGGIVRPHNAGTDLDPGAFKKLKSELIAILPDNWFDILSSKFNISSNIAMSTNKFKR